MGFDFAEYGKFNEKDDMKILITTGIFPPDIGGPSRMVERLANDLVVNGNEVTVLTFGQEDQERRSYKVKKASGKISFFSNIYKLGRQVDVIYTFDLYTAGFLSWLVGKVWLKKKLVVRFAGDSAWEFAVNQGYTTDDIVAFQAKKYGWRILWKKKARLLILQGADKVVAVSNFMKELAVKIGVKPANIEVIYNAVDFVDFKGEKSVELRNTLDLPADCRIIMTAARLVPWKGIDGLIQAVAKLKLDASLPNLKLLVIGEGKDLGRLKKIAKEEGVEDLVVFTGRISLDKIFDYYRLADVFVLNSNYEGLSHVLLEVLSLGIPVVASKSGGNPEVVEHNENGILIKYNDVEDLSLAIKKILQDEKWQSDEYKKKCLKSLEKFSWSNNVKQTVEFLKEM